MVSSSRCSTGSRSSASPTDDDVIDTIEVIAQVDLEADYPYLVDVGGLPCWPSQPAWDHIVGGDGLRARRSRSRADRQSVESHTDGAATRRRLRSGRARHLDRWTRGRSAPSSGRAESEVPGDARQPHHRRDARGAGVVGEAARRTSAGPRRSARSRRATPSRSTRTATCRTSSRAKRSLRTRSTASATSADRCRTPVDHDARSRGGQAGGDSTTSPPR